MADENTSSNSATNKPNASDVTTTTKITAANFNAMVDILEKLANHTHIFYDDYTTVCQCQCQCQCTRGTL
jgi:hypothetical protein